MSELTIKKKTPLKLGIAALAAAGLVLSGASAASAADFQIDIDDIAGFENGTEGDDGYNYDQWHIASVYNDALGADASITMLEQGVQFEEVPAESGSSATITQIMKGYAIDSRPSTVTDIEAAINSIEIDVEEGSVTLQLPFFAQDEEFPGDPTWLGTFRNTEPFGPGVHTLTPDTELINSLYPDVGTLAVFFELLEETYADADGTYWLELIGIGFTGTPGTVVNSITFDGNTYYFGSGDLLDEEEDEEENDDEAAEDDEIVAPTPPESVETGIL